MTAQAVGAQALPELSVDYMSTLSSSSVAIGGSVTLNYGVINFGNAVAGASNSGIYLSTDRTITTSDTLLRTDSVQSISPNYGEWEQIDITIPVTVAAGTYYIGAIADYNNAITESNEANNSLTGLGITIGGPGLPDLNLNDVPYLNSSSVVSGDSVTLSYYVNNLLGNVVAGGSTSGIYLSTDSTITTSDTLVATDGVQSISSGYKEYEQANVTIPGTLAAGTYYIGVIADYNNAITESNEANNSSPGVAIAVTATGLPDLDVLGAVTPGSYSVTKGETVKLSFDVYNVGNVTAGASTTGIYLSTDSIITTSDTLLSMDSVASIAAKGSTKENVSVTLPTTLAPGTYYIGAIPDYNNAVAEGNETNNPSIGVPIVLTQDDYAGSSSTSGYIAIGGSATGNLEISGDIDWFRVELTRGVRYAVDVKGASSGSGTLSDPYFTLCSSGGASLSSFDGGGVGTDASGGLLPLDSGGTYYIAVRHKSSGAGTYVVSIAEAQDDYTANIATTGSLAIGGTASGNLEVTYDHDYFRVELVAGNAYQFDLKGSSSGGGTLGNPALTLHDSSNTALRYDDNGGRPFLGTSNDAQIVYIPQESGTYFLDVGGLYSSGTYQLTAKTLDPDYYVQGILDQPNVRWNADAPMGTPVNVTYSFPDTLPSEYAAADIGNYQPFTEAQKAAAAEILSTISTYANITFTEVDGSSGQIRFWTAYEEGVAKAVTLAYPSGDALTLADIALANEVSANASPSAGTTGYVTLLHEIGHALGLKHPGDYSAVGDEPSPPYLPTSQDASAYTVETYNMGGIPDKSPMPFDVAALQYLYGANLATQAGDDTYTFSPNSDYTIWDAAGTDTLSAASLGISVTLDLNPGTVSYRAYIGGLTSYTPIVAIAFNTTIENAVGGGEKDTLLGNAANNTLTGGGGNDRIDGGAGIDIAVYAGNRGNYTLADSGDPVLGYTVAAKTGSEGTDNLFDVERLKFADASVAIDLAGNAGNAAKIIGALFGKQYLHTKEYVGTGLRMFDSGQTMEQVAKFAMGTDLFEQLFGSGSNTDFVKLVYKNIAGSDPGAADLDNFVHLLDSGAYTQASLAVLAAEDGLNKINIDLVGLAQTGIEYA